VSVNIALPFTLNAKSFVLYAPADLREELADATELLVKYAWSELFFRT
jgi:hypothetical protein